MNRKNICNQSKLWDEIFLEEIKNGIDVTEAPPYIDNVIKLTDKNSFILESGCGIGKTLIYLLNLGYKNLYGVDFAYDTINVMKKLFPNIHYTCSDIIKINFEDEFFDLIISWSVIDHLESGIQEKAIREKYRLLKKGGYLIITVPYKNLFHYSPLIPAINFIKGNILIRKIFGFKPIRKSFIQYFFSERKIKKMLLNTGFKIKELKLESLEMGFIRALHMHFIRKFITIEDLQKKRIPLLFAKSLKRISPRFTCDELLIIAEK